MNNIFSNIWFLYNWISFKRKIQLLLLIGFSIFVSIMEIVTVGSVVPFVSSVLNSESEFGSNIIKIFKDKFDLKENNSLIFFLAIVFICFAIITGICRSILIYIISRYSNVVLAEIGREIYNQKLNEPFIKFISTSSDEIISLISAKLLQIYGVISGILLFITSSILLVAIISILFFIDFDLTLISLSVFGILYFLVVLLFKKTLLYNSQIISKNQTLMVKSLQEGVGSIRDIILDGSQNIHVQSFSKLIFQRGFKVAINDLLSQSPRFLLETVGIVLISIFLFFFYNTDEGILTLFPVLSALALGAQKIMPLMNIIYTNYATALGNAHQLNEAMDALREKTQKTEIEVNHEEIFFENKILIKNVSFKYKDHLPYTIQNINFEIPKGSKIGIVGKTGVGKSTLLDIIMGLLSPTQGQVYVDRNLISQRNKISWRKKVTHVPQDIFLTNGTILQNIALNINKNDIDISIVERCAKIANIYEFILQLPSQFNEKVGERGIRLSGGQKQRIGIARALYRNSELIVFDEATNALDTNTEKKIINSITELKNVTIVMVAHRIDTLKECDQVYEVHKDIIKKVNI